MNNAKKLIIYNPHADPLFSYTVFGKIFTKIHSPGGKYFYIIKYLLEKQDKLIIYLSRGVSSFPRPLKYFIPSKLEIYLWCKTNKIDYKKVQIIEGKDLETMDKEFVLWGLLRKINDPDIEIFRKTGAITCFSMSHFSIGHSKKYSNYVERIEPDYLVSESNLFKNSAFFRKYFPYYKKDVIVMSFVPQQRFKAVKPFLERKNECVTTGTFIEYPPSAMDKQFYEFYNINTYQPVRKMIYYNKDILSGYVDSHMTRYTTEEVESGKGPSKFTFLENLMKFFRKAHYVFFGKKKEYFSFNIVDLYNDYRMCVVGEETELPGIGFVEGMSCGCAYIGQDLPFYKDIGMAPGKHFITYDGTAVDLKNKIAYYQKHPKELEKIAEAGKKFVEENCNYKTVVENFLKRLG